jgi:soluble lytic murein transglycosylase-like protein
MGALGLMQIMLDTARDVMGDPNVTKEMLLDPFYNVEVGTKYLAWLLKFYDGNLDLALTAYNRGVGRVEKLRAEGQDPDNGYKDLVFGVL